MQHFEQKIFKNFSKTPLERSRKHIYFYIIFRIYREFIAFSGPSGGFATFFQTQFWAHLTPQIRTIRA
jgi:hypothetical protein